MGIAFIESFDGVDTTGCQAKGWAFAGSISVVATSPRTGTNCLQNTSFVASALKSIPAALQSDTITVGFGLYTTSLSANSSICSLRGDGGVTEHVSLQVTTSGEIQVRRGFTSSGTLLGTSSGAGITVNTWYYVEVKAKLHDTTGTVEIHVNEAQVLNLTGQDTKNAGTATVFDSVAFGGDSAIGGTGTQRFDDIYCLTAAGGGATTFLGDCKVECSLPSGDGGHSDFTGSDGNSTNNSLLVDETPQNATDYVASSTASQLDTYAYTDLASTSGSVAAVQISTFAEKTDAGTRTYDNVTRISGTDYLSSAISPSNGSYAFGTTLQETNPANSSAWLRSDVNSAEFGVKCL